MRADRRLGTRIGAGRGVDPSAGFDRRWCIIFGRLRRGEVTPWLRVVGTGDSYGPPLWPSANDVICKTSAVPPIQSVVSRLCLGQLGSAKPHFSVMIAACPVESCTD